MWAPLKGFPSGTCISSETLISSETKKFFLQVQITSQDSMCKLKYQAFQLAKAPDRQIPILYAAISIALSIQLN